MCGRFTLAQPEKIAEQFQVPLNPVPPARFNIAPQQPLNVICEVERRRQMRLMLWGLIPFWAKDASIGQKLINARSETAHEKPSFRSAFRYRRCLIPADGYYEWQSRSQGKQPYYFSNADQNLFAIAGLWESWNDIETVVILTTQANSLMKPVHHRMPVIIEPQNYQRWLNPFTSWKEMVPLMKSQEHDWMRCYPVSAQVNRPSVDQPSCIAPITLE